MATLGWMIRLGRWYTRKPKLVGFSALVVLILVLAGASVATGFTHGFLPNLLLNAACHTPDLGGIAGIYSDFLLHRLDDRSYGGKGYREIPPVPLPEDFPLPEEWKTPPLWGVADSAPYFHDGGSATLESAILRHRGDAEVVYTAFRALGPEDRDALIAFLKTLRAPADAEPAPAPAPSPAPRSSPVKPKETIALAETALPIARTAWLQGDFARVKEALAQLADKTDFLDADTAVEIDLLLGKAHVAFDDTALAVAAFARVLARKPRFELSPYHDSPKVLEAWQKAVSQLSPP